MLDELEVLGRIWAKRLRERRIAKGLSQGELGAAVGKSRSQVNRWEKSGEVPDAKTVWLCSKALDTSSAYLIGTRATPDQPEYPTPDEREMLALYRRLGPKRQRLAKAVILETFEVMIKQGGPRCA